MFNDATDAYVWSIPMIGLKGWENANVDAGADPNLDGQFVRYAGYDAVRGILTPNQIVEYIIAFGNLDVQGPMIWEIPAGTTAGYVADQWQRPLIDVGVTGPDKGQGVKIVVVGPGQDVPKNFPIGAVVVESPTNFVWFGVRNMETDPERIEEVNSGLTVYPMARPDLRGREMIRAGNDAFIQAQPRGMKYWEEVNAIIQRERGNIHERDVFYMAKLKNLGIQYGLAFDPSPEMIQLLTDAEEIGYRITLNNSFKKRFEGAQYYEGKNWYLALINNPDQVQDTHGELYERASWFHEAISSTRAMKLTGPGPGSTYLGSYADRNGEGFDGGKTYRLMIPADVPAGQFWAMTVYNNKYRNLILNENKQSEVNSLRDIVIEDDGTVQVFIGPESPEGYENNWIQTTKGQTWFTYFRFFNPEKPYFDKSWQLNDIEEIP